MAAEMRKKNEAYDAMRKALQRLESELEILKQGRLLR
jgi:hypothetical protein